METTTPSDAAPAPSTSDDVMAQLEPFRRELTAYCYRMLGSPFEAEDAAQEALTRAWKGFDRFEGRSALRSWLYRITTNVCFDSLDKRRKRALPMDLGAASSWDGPLGAALPESEWVLPTPDGRVLPPSEDPAEAALMRDSIRLAFVAALQHLPPRQRAVLILREVLRWEASEVARLLDTTVASVNSALQRARATIDEIDADDGDVNRLDDAHRQLLDRYEDAFLRYDVDALVALLREDATLSMPPFPFWLRGAEDAGRFWASPGPSACRDSRLVRVDVNGSPGFAQWKPNAEGTGHEAWAVHVMDVVDGRITRIDYFLDTPAVFPLFGLPLVWPGD
ncbi:MAG TPA: sigma-70 family RNA polymerase sigma factor [Acidimicrobiales bacterium]